MIYTVKITFADGTTDIKECHDVSEIILDNVVSIKVLREEDEVYTCNDNCKRISTRKKHTDKQDDSK